VFCGSCFNGLVRIAEKRAKQVVIPWRSTVGNQRIADLRQESPIAAFPQFGYLFRWIQKKRMAGTLYLTCNRSAGLEAALRPAAMEGATHLPLQTSPTRDSEGLVIAVNAYGKPGNRIHGLEKSLGTYHNVHEPFQERAGSPSTTGSATGSAEP
jgi:hypothetical protein